MSVQGHFFRLRCLRDHLLAVAMFQMLDGARYQMIDISGPRGPAQCLVPTDVSEQSPANM